MLNSLLKTGAKTNFTSRVSLLNAVNSRSLHTPLGSTTKKDESY